MTNTIKLKRGSGSDPSASDMVVGEPVLRSDTAELFFKKDDGSVAKVSGGGSGGSSFQYLALRNAANDGAASYPGNDFTLVTSGTTTAVSPATANALILSYGGVVQKPNSGTSTSGITGFIVDGSRLKTATNFAAAPDFIVYQESGGIGEPSDNTVTEAKLNASNSPTNGYFLQAQSGVTGGLTWAAAPANDSSTGIDFDDNVKARWGTGNDLELFHDGNNSYIDNSTGNLYIRSGGNAISIRAKDDEQSILCHANAAVELYYDGVKKIETATDKILFYAHAKVNADNTYDLGASGARWRDLYISNDIDISDNGKLLLGNSDDLQIFHNGTHSEIADAGTGDLRLLTSKFKVLNNPASADENMIVATENGAVELYWNGFKSFNTTDTGIHVFGPTDTEAQIYMYADNGNAADDKWKLKADYVASGFYIQNYKDGAWEDSIRCFGGGATELFHNNSKKFFTTSDGTATTGEATITSAGYAGKPTLTLGANNSSSSTSLTNSTSKACRVGVYHYTNAEEPAAIFYAVGSDTTNQVNYGGGTSWMNAATHHKFFTADDITTTSGTERLRIDGNGRVSINTDTPHCANKGVHIKTGDSGVTSASTNRDDIFIEGSDHSGITISTANNKTGGIGFDDPDGNRGRIQYSHSSDKMQIYTSGTNSFEFTDDLDILDGNLKVASGHGIDFSANANATGNTSNLLDDYESGSWTATVVTGTCSQQSCKYIKIGNQCTVWGRIHGLSDTSTNIVLKIEGLPYGCNISAAAGNKFSKDISTDANCTYITTAEQLMFYGHNTGNAWSYVTHLSCGSNMEIYFYGTYRTEYPGSN